MVFDVLTRASPTSHHRAHLCLLNAKISKLEYDQGFSLLFIKDKVGFR